MEKIESTDRRGIDGNLVDDGSDAQHTPTPWKWEERPIEISGTFFEMVTEKGRIPTGLLQERIDEDLSYRSAIKNNQANMEFIVRAVNSHLELVSLLKDVLEIEYIDQTGTLTPLLHAGDLRGTIVKTLAKAEGR